MEKLGEAFKGRLEFAYHRTSEQNIPSIVKDGFIPGYGDMYGKGWYMCYDLESQLNPTMTTYGNGVIKTQIFDKGVLIFDYNVSKELYGNKYSLVDQLVNQGIFKDAQAVPAFYKAMSEACEGSFSYPPRSADIAYNCFVQGRDPVKYLDGKNTQGYSWGEGNSCLNAKGVPRINKITAIVFSGNHDGNVVVGYSPNTVLPIAYAIIDSQVCSDYKAGKIKVSDIEFTPLKDYEIAEERARQARDLYERLGALRNSSIISLNLLYNKMTTAEFEKNFRWIARDSKVTNAEITIDKDGKFIFEAGSWDNGTWQGDSFGTQLGAARGDRPVFKGGIFTKGAFYGTWEFGRFTGGLFEGIWAGKGSKRAGGTWSAPPECWGPNAILYTGATIMYETKPGSGKYVESNLTPPQFYKSLEGPEVKFSNDNKILLSFDNNFIGNYEVPNGVETIGDSAFKNCKLKGITIPNTVKNIDKQAFFGCENLSKVQLGNGLSYIGVEAFKLCKSLREITLPTGLLHVDSFAFMYSGLNICSFPNSIKLLGESIFQGCLSLSYVKLPSSIYEVPKYMFANCNRLFKVDIPDNYTIIDKYAFYGCNKLRMIKFPSQLTEIRENAFYNSGLTEIDLSSKVDVLQNSAFAYSPIQTVKMYPITTRCDGTVFDGTKLKTIIFNGTMAQWQSMGVSLYNVTVKCKDGELTP